MNILTKEYLNTLLNNGSDITIALTSKFIIKDFNKKAEEYFVINSENAKGSNIFELFASKGLQTPIGASYNNTIIEKNIIYHNLKGEQNKHILSWKIIPIINAEKETTFIIMIAGIEEYDDFYNTSKNITQFINCTPGSLYWKSRDGKYLGCNAFMVKTSGLNSAMDIIGKTDFDLWPKENAKKLYENDQHVIKTGETIITNEKVTIASGKTMYFTGVKMPLRDNNNNIIGVIGNSLDVTDLEVVKQSLKVAKEKAESANKTKTDFLYNMRHDFRTPFNGILGMSRLLYDSETNNNKKEQLHSIIKASQGLLDQLDEIIEFVSIEDGVLVVSEKQFDLYKIVEDMKNLILPATKEKGLKFIIEVTEEVPKYIIGDSTRTQRILMNLLTNAVKFTNAGHVLLSISIGKIEDNNIVLKFTVKDTGLGMSKEGKDVIFEKFSRLIPSYKGLYQGNGLGLRIVKQFLDEMNGEIHVESKLNKGSTFIVLIPYKLPLLGCDEKELLIKTREYSDELKVSA